MLPLSNENAVWSSLKRALQAEQFYCIKTADKSTVGILDCVAISRHGVHWWIETKIRRRRNVMAQLSGTQLATLVKLRERGVSADVVYYDPKAILPWRIIVRWAYEEGKLTPIISNEAEFTTARELVKQYAPRS